MWSSICSHLRAESQLSNLLLKSGNGGRIFIRTVTKVKKKDLEKHKKLPVFDYSRVHLEKKRLYVFGASYGGALGLDNLLRPKGQRHKLMMFTNRPVRHKFCYDMDLRDIAAGHAFTLVGINRHDQNMPAMFGFGQNDTTQLGYQSARVGAPLTQLIAPVGVPLPVKAEKPQILAVGAGRGHSAVSIKGEGLITWGDNSRGQCGRFIHSTEKYFGSHVSHRIPSFGANEASEIIQIASRFDITACVSRAGKVFTFGEHEQGQLGRGRLVVKTWDTTEPLRGDIESLKITKVSTNGSSVLAVSENGELFGWGNNELSHLTSSLSPHLHFDPKFIKLPSKVGKVVDVAVGNVTCFILNDKGDVYSWGLGPALGLGPSQTRVKDPCLMPPPLFGRNEFSQNVKVVSIETAFDHAAAINSIGDIFTWGTNPSGCLGLGKDIPQQFFPLKVCLNGAGIKIVFGVDHTVVLTKGSF